MVGQKMEPHLFISQFLAVIEARTVTKEIG